MASVFCYSIPRVLTDLTIEDIIMESMNPLKDFQVFETAEKIDAVKETLKFEEASLKSPKIKHSKRKHKEIKEGSSRNLRTPSKREPVDASAEKLAFPVHEIDAFRKFLKQEGNKTSKGTPCWDKLGVFMKKEVGRSKIIDSLDG